MNEKIAAPLPIDRGRLLAAMTSVGHDVNLGFDPAANVVAVEATVSMMLGEAAVDLAVQFTSNGGRQPTNDDIARLRLLSIRRVLNRLNVRRDDEVNNWWYRLLLSYGW